MGQLEFKFYSDMKAEEAQQKRRQEKASDKMYWGCFLGGPLLIATLTFGVPYMDNHPEIVEGVKTCISNLF